MRYRPEKERVCEGAFATVHVATDLSTGRCVALKRVRLAKPNAVASDPELTLVREVLSLSAVDHPNVVPLVDHFADGGSLVIVMPYLPSNLAALLDGLAHPLPEQPARALASMLLAGLAACHEAGLLHRDIKPANLLLGTDGVLRIGDFGQARLAPSNGGEATPHVGTRWYRAPELLLGAREYGSAVDLWAAGCVIAQFYTVSPLLLGESDIGQFLRVVQLLGSPNEDRWPGVTSLPDYDKLEIPVCEPASLGVWLAGAPPEAVQLIAAMLRYAPSTRIGAAEAHGQIWPLDHQASEARAWLRRFVAQRPTARGDAPPATHIMAPVVAAAMDDEMRVVQHMLADGREATPRRCD